METFVVQDDRTAWDHAVAIHEGIRVSTSCLCDRQRLTSPARVQAGRADNCTHNSSSSTRFQLFRPATAKAGEEALEEGRQPLLLCVRCR